LWIIPQPDMDALHQRKVDYVVVHPYALTADLLCDLARYIAQTTDDPASKQVLSKEQVLTKVGTNGTTLYLAPGTDASNCVKQAPRRQTDLTCEDFPIPGEGGLAAGAVVEALSCSIDPSSGPWIQHATGWSAGWLIAQVS
jgi:hypothetical protein